MNILVAIDFSEASQKVLGEAKRLGSGLSSKLWVLHVASPNPGFIGYEGGFADYGAGFVDYGPDPKALRKEIAKRFHKEHQDLQKEATRLREAGIDTTALLIQGETLKVLLQEIEKLKIDVVVVGSHGHGAVYNLIVGSVSEGLLKKSSCPVLVIPSQDHAKKEPSASLST